MLDIYVEEIVYLGVDEMQTGAWLPVPQYAMAYLKFCRKKKSAGGGGGEARNYLYANTPWLI